MAIFPQSDGDFSSLDLVTKSHYEVHGDSTTVERSEAVLPTAQPVRFSFHRPTSTATSSFCPTPRSTTKSFVRWGNFYSLLKYPLSPLLLLICGLHYLHRWVQFCLLVNPAYYGSTVHPKVLILIWPSAMSKSQELQFLDKGKMCDGSIIMECCRAAEMSWLTILVLQM